MNDVATWAVTCISTFAAILGVVFGWPTFSEWRQSKKSARIQSNPGSGTLKTVTGEGLLRVGCIPFPPLIHCPSDPISTTGLYRLIFDDIGARLGWTIEYVPLRNDTAMESLLTRKVDVVACLLETPQRAARARFTARIHQMAICGVVRLDSTKITSQIDLRRPDVKAIVAEGEIGAEVARQHFGMSPDNGRLHELVTRDVSSIFGPVVTRDADVAITDGVTCIDYLESDSDTTKLLVLRFTEDPLWLVPCGLMIRPGEDDFAALLDDEVRRSMAGDAICSANRKMTAHYRALLRPM